MGREVWAVEKQLEDYLKLLTGDGAAEVNDELAVAFHAAAADAGNNLTQCLEDLKTLG